VLSSIAYLSFDTVPAPKGASTHIEAFTRALGRAFGAIELVTVSAAMTPGPGLERWPGVFHTELPGVGVSLIDRVISFRRFLEFWLAQRRLDVVQFRSIFEGIPLLRLRPRPRLIFEVNGLPSIELKHRYPRVVDDRELMRKLVLQERACLQAADRIVTPSAVTARYLSAARGVDPARIRVIPNGVDPALFRPAARVANQDALNLLYFGTLSSWQGVDLAVRATAQICAQVPACLTVLGVGNNRQRELLSALAAKLGIAQRVEILPPVEQAQVAEALHRAFAMLAPLPVNDRNTKQGCCPLKILEGMAAGVPVIASDLPVVRELGEHGSHLLLVKPGSVDQIARAVLDLHADPDLWQRLAAGGREHILRRYTWDHAGTALAAVYTELGMSRASNV
jgi:glycosyltransferase involved in cell wall biosynthesis